MNFRIGREDVKDKEHDLDDVLMDPTNTVKHNLHHLNWLMIKSLPKCEEEPLDSCHLRMNITVNGCKTLTILIAHTSKNY